jgi:hypothetical protein
VLVLRRPGVTGDNVKQGRSVGAKLGVAGKKTGIRVNFGGGVVVVAGAQVQVAADALFLPADHQGDFTVGFQPVQAIDYVAAGLFQLF